MSRGNFLYQRTGKGLHNMTVLLKEPGNPLKNAGDPLFFLCLTNKNAALWEVIGNHLVLAPFREERRRNEGNVIKNLYLSHGLWRFNYMVGKS